MRFRAARLQPEPGRRLLDLLVRQGQLLLSICGGRGGCGKCRVRIDRGRVSPLTEKELRILTPAEIQSGFRLACSCSAQGAVMVSVPEWEVMSGSPSVRSRGKGQTAKCQAKVKVTGLALDIGTTNVAVAGYELGQGSLQRTGSFLNPQISFGMDVISRISQSPALIRDDALIPAIRGLVESWGISVSDIRRIVAVGNTTMCHFLFRRDASSLGVYPYRSALPLQTPLEQLVPGLGRRKVGVLPMIGSYLGADAVAAIVASGLSRGKGLSLLVDLGTNGEIVLGNQERLLACSTAAGPALEGSNLSCGVLARPGAITDCRIGRLRQGVPEFEFRVRGGGKPVGLCGSAVIKLLGELAGRKLVEPNGRISGRKPIRLVPAEASGTGRDIVLSQGDVRELQLAKAAIAAGIRILLQESGARAADVRRVYLTGLLGGRLDRAAAMRIGLLPGLKHAAISQQPNLALAGAQLALLEPERLAEFTAAARRTREVLLGSHPEFNSVFVESLRLAPWE
jgi:uncharacterized 2Fe-2S/4Fe-4S cluster protein (DUF4445 family)